MMGERIGHAWPKNEKALAQKNPLHGFSFLAQAACTAPPRTAFQKAGARKTGAPQVPTPERHAVADNERLRIMISRPMLAQSMARVTLGVVKK